tara:strand:- start:7227 stop:7994 length:768 start_codon:yes stop_codon:yes gene_type:complete
MKKSRIKPLVSIITPNFNGEKYIEQTIKSVIGQNFRNIEYIIIDGKSTDRSIKIINKYKSHINYFESKNDNGIFHAVHKGILKSKGKYIIWINSDDVLHPNAAKNVVEIFKNNPDINWINGICGYIKFNFRFFFIPYIYPRNIIISGKAHKKFYGYIQQESVSFKKSLYLKSGGLDTSSKSGGDFFLWQKFAKLTELKTYFIKIGYFRSHKNQISKNKNSYEKFTGFYSNKFDLNIKRLIFSLINLPIILLKTFL